MNYLNLATSVGEIFKRWPKTVELFVYHRMGCPGCYLAEFESLEMALNAYNIPVESFLESLIKTINEGDQFE